MMSVRNIEYLGWGTFIGLTLILSVPCGYFGYSYISEAYEPLGRILFGVCLAGVIAGVLTFAGNALLQRGIEQRQRRAEAVAEAAQAQQQLERKLHRKEKKQQRGKRGSTEDNGGAR